MKSRGGFGGSGAASESGTSGASGEQKKDWVASCSAKAEWNLMRDPEDEDVVESVDFTDDQRARRLPVGLR
jgi:hypothetical protein